MIKTALIYFIFDYCIDKLFEPIINAFDPPLFAKLQFDKMYSEISTSSNVGSLAIAMEVLNRIDCTYYNCILHDGGNNGIMSLHSITYERCSMVLYFDSVEAALLKRKVINTRESVEVIGKSIHLKSGVGQSMVSMNSIVGFVE